MASFKDRCITNIVIYEHAEDAYILKVIEAYNHDKLFAEFIPIPSDLKIEAQYPLSAQQKRNLEVHGYTDWYDFCTHEWGTKWDIGVSCDKAEIMLIEPKKFIVKFECADSPPINYYYYLVENLEYNITAYYCSADKKSCGAYLRKHGHKHYEVDDTPKLPPILNELFGLYES